MNKIELLILEETSIPAQDFNNLHEDNKPSAVHEITNLVLKSLEYKMSRLETSIIDRTNGDIKHLKYINEIQEALDIIDRIVETNKGKLPEDVKGAISEIKKAIMKINKHTEMFKSAYRRRNTSLILKYEVLAMSLISAVSYLISALVDLTTAELLPLERVRYVETSDIRAIKDFNIKDDRGYFKEEIKDVLALREGFLEVDEKYLGLLESTDMISVVINGLKNIYGSLDNRGKITGMLYKAAGFITLLLSMREVIAAFYRSRVKLGEKLEFIKNFVDLKSNKASTGILGKLVSFSDKLLIDTEESSNLAKRDVEDDNRDLIRVVRDVSSRESNNVDSGDVDFGSLGF